MRTAPALALLVGLLLTPFVATAGGALDRFERAHTRPSPSPSPSSRDDDDDSSYDSSYETTYDDDDDDDDDSSYETTYDDDDGGSSTTVSGGTWGRIGAWTFCALAVPAQFACFHRAHHVAVKPYDHRGLYVHPQEDPAEVTPAAFSQQTYTNEDFARWRWFELEVTGFRAMNEADILTHDITGRLWLGPVFLRGTWERFHERIPETGQFDSLDLARVHVDANILGPYLDWVEMYGGIGLSLLKGEETTPAFDIDLDMRVYPIEPFTFRVATTFSIYEIGPVLADSRFQLGVALDRVEVRAGPRWLYQGEAQGFWGPSAAVAVRF